MRDAFGSTFMFRLIIIFIVFYVSFATIAVSYAKTFRLKNGVVDIVEQNQLGYNNGEKDNRVISKVEAFLNESNYNYRNNRQANSRLRGLCNTSNKNIKYIDNGVCLEKVVYDDGGKGSFYYKVTLYMVIDFPVLTYDPIIPVGGNTSDYGNFNS